MVIIREHNKKITAGNIENLDYIKYAASVYQENKNSTALKSRNKKVLLLDLSKCKLSKMDHTVEKLTRLQELYCNNNLLITLSNVKLPDSLKILIASNNTIVSIDDSICNAKNLRDLELTNNKITRINPNIIKLEKLRYLHLDHNFISLFSPYLCQMNLVCINLSYNSLRNLPSAIGNLKSLKSLLLDNNLLEEFPKELYDLTGLQLLSAKNNKIRLISESITQMISLEYINLDGNYSDSFNPVVKEFINNINKKFTKSNPHPHSLLSLRPSLNLSTNETKSTLRLPSDFSKLTRKEFNNVNNSIIDRFIEYLHNNNDNQMDLAKSSDLLHTRFSKEEYNTMFSNKMFNNPRLSTRLNKKMFSNIFPVRLMYTAFGLCEKKETLNLLIVTIKEIIRLINTDTIITEQLIASYIIKYVSIFPSNLYDSLRKIIYSALGYVEDPENVIPSENMINGAPTKNISYQSFDNHELENQTIINAFLFEMQKNITFAVPAREIQKLANCHMSNFYASIFQSRKILYNEDWHQYVKNLSQLTMYDLFCILCGISLKQGTINQLFKVCEQIIDQIEKRVVVNEEFVVRYIRKNYTIFANNNWLQEVLNQLHFTKSSLIEPKTSRLLVKESEIDMDHVNYVVGFIDFIISTYPGYIVSQSTYFKMANTYFDEEQREIFRDYILNNSIIQEIFKIVKYDETPIHFFRILLGILEDKEVVPGYSMYMREILMEINKGSLTCKYVFERARIVAALLNIDGKVICSRFVCDKIYQESLRAAIMSFNSLKIEQPEELMLEQEKPTEIIIPRSEIQTKNLTYTEIQIEKYLTNREAHKNKIILLINYQDCLTKTNLKIQTLTRIVNFCSDRTIHPNFNECFKDIFFRILYIHEFTDGKTFTCELLDSFAQMSRGKDIITATENLIRVYNILIECLYPSVTHIQSTDNTYEAHNKKEK